MTNNTCNNDLLKSLRLVSANEAQCCDYDIAMSRAHIYDLAALRESNVTRKRLLTKISDVYYERATEISRALTSTKKD